MARAPLPLLTFVDRGAFEAWLAGQTAGAEGAWLRFAKQGAPEQTIAKTEAIDCALAYGWIDGQLGRVDDLYFKTHFTPRRPASPWSQANRERAERLIADGRMTPEGQPKSSAQKPTGAGTGPMRANHKPSLPPTLKPPWTRSPRPARCSTG